ncbi:Diphthamide biosynthesis protein [Pseudoloma neurophilia]|uniref:Diphthamide biosynthesis protein n=1 Tax=Pseudoloma neurophilia TaxID=146866 RepID=A0A0R0LYR2_9MICR|nr:Diphthamide biosynthesis protein [Pseudoloma neurophilia]
MSNQGITTKNRVNGLNNSKNKVKTQFYRYCPFNKKMYKESYNYLRMLSLRQKQQINYKKSSFVGIIISRTINQTSDRLLKNVLDKIVSDGKKYYILNIEEINQDILKYYSRLCEGFVQLCCTRLSIDWGHLLCDESEKTLTRDLEEDEEVINTEKKTSEDDVLINTEKKTSIKDHFVLNTEPPISVGFVLNAYELWNSAYKEMDYYSENDQQWSNSFISKYY